MKMGSLGCTDPFCYKKSAATLCLLPSLLLLVFSSALRAILFSACYYDSSLEAHQTAFEVTRYFLDTAICDSNSVILVLASSWKPSTDYAKSFQSKLYPFRNSFKLLRGFADPFHRAPCYQVSILTSRLAFSNDLAHVRKWTFLFG